MNNLIKVSKVAGGKKPMDMIWVIGFIVFYFALQLWILPKLGIST